VFDRKMAKKTGDINKNSKYEEKDKDG